MSRTWKDLVSAEEKRFEALEHKYRLALAKAKARNEVLLAMTTGKLQAKQIQGNVFSGKAAGMTRAIQFDLEKLISLRAESLLAG